MRVLDSISNRILREKVGGDVAGGKKKPRRKGGKRNLPLLGKKTGQLSKMT